MSFARYPEYKNSGVEWLGEVPVHWSMQRFKLIFSERMERSENGDELLLSVSAYTGVSPRSEVIDEGDHLSRAESLVGYKKCFKDDLVMNIMLAWNRGLAFTKYEGIVSPAYCVFRVINESDPRFLNYLVRSDEYTLYFKAFSTGVIDSRLRIYPETFGSLFSALPSPDEQTAIATFLDHETAKIDTLVAEQEKLIALLKEKRQAVISHAVTKGLDPSVPMKDSGVEWLGEVPGHWIVARLGYFATVENGTTPSRDSLSYWEDGTVPWIASGSVSNLYVQTADELISELALKQCSLRVLPIDTVIVGLIGQGKTRGMSALLKIPATINQNLAAVCPGPLANASFILFLFHAMYAWLREAGRGGNQAAMNCEMLRALKIPLPAFAEQIEIVEYIEAQDARFTLLSEQAQLAITLLQERRTALISAAVTGQIDVRGFAPAEAA